MRRLLAALTLLLACALPAGAEEDTYTLRALGDRWYQTVYELVTLESGDAGTYVLDLDDIPGGIDGTPAIHARSVSAPGSPFTIFPINFHPLAYGAYVPDAMYVLRNESGETQTYRIKLTIRGKE